MIFNVGEAILTLDIAWMVRKDVIKWNNTLLWYSLNVHLTYCPRSRYLLYFQSFVPEILLDWSVRENFYANENKWILMKKVWIFIQLIAIELAFCFQSFVKTQKFGPVMFQDWSIREKTIEVKKIVIYQ